MTDIVKRLRRGRSEAMKTVAMMKLALALIVVLIAVGPEIIRMLQ